jgi:tetratricopeptide (TPR) repeat protein
MNDLQESIELAEKALTLMPVDYHDRRRHMYETADLLSDRFVRTGEPKDLDRAIELASFCLDGLEPGKPLFAERSDRLSLLLCERFVLVGMREDLENAIFHSRRACEVTEPTHYLYGQYVAGHASYLTMRFERERVLSDFNSAEEILEYALEVTDERYSNKSLVYSTLAKLLYVKYQITKAMEDLRDAIDFMEKALAGKPGGPGYPSLRTQLGNFYEQRYQRTRDRKDLDTAIAYAAEGVEALPEDHWDRARLLDHLAYQLKQKWLASGEAFDLQAAADAYKKGFLAETSPPINRIECGKDGAHLLYETSQARPALHLLQGCLKLFPKVHSRRLGWKDQQYWLTTLCSGLASDAAAIALQMGRAQAPSLALSCLETGASLIMGAFINCRSDVSELAAVNPELAARFERLRLEVDVPLLLDVNNGAGVRGVEYEAGQQRRREATDALDDILKEIRAIPGFADFLLSLSESKLVALAKYGGGPIVILNSSHLVGRADAIIITETGISALHLSGLQYAASSPLLTETKEKFSDAEIYSGSLRTVATRNKRLSHILKILWEGAVQPVMKHLEYSPCADPHKLPHICWIRRGWPFNAAPIHAAGIYNSQDTTANTMAYVVSSYAPSLKALMYARERDVGLLKMTPQRSSRLLVVTMPKTPGSTDLPGVETEAEHITAACNGVLETEVLEAPTADSVLRRLKDAQAVHFACHGCTDTKDLSSSYLALCKPADANPNLDPHDNRKNNTTANIIVDPLTVRDIASSLVTLTSSSSSSSSSPQHPHRKISGPQLAYLSACSTAATASNQRMADEAVHLAAGFLLAGFSHVIATLWDTHSDICVEVAEAFYAELVRERGDVLLGEEEGDAGKAARNRKIRVTLHVAVLKVRERRLRLPLAWAGFVHLGA